MFLTADDLVQLTGYRRSSAQRRRLDALGVPYHATRSGRPVVTWDAVNGQALLGHTTRAMSERYIKTRQVVQATPVRRKL